jgi:cytosine/adenosine deaminase-related metal-dependent hydrolase
MLAPERIETITPDLLRASKRWSDELDCPIRLHAAQGPYEFGEIRRRHAKTPIQFLADIGFLGPRTSIPHAVYVTGSRVAAGAAGDDLGLLAESGTTVIHCPVIMARYNEGLESFGRYQRAGVRLALGTDTFPPDMLQNIRVGSYLARVIDQSPRGNTFADFFRAATLGGAQALGRPDLGRLTPGAKADLIVIRLDAFHFGVLDDPIRTLFISGTGHDVQTVIINGKVVMQDRVIPGVDLDALQAHATRYFANFKTGYLERDYRQLPPEQLFPTSFPIVPRR